MIEPNYIESKIQTQWPGSEVIVRDLTGTQDHYQVVVVSPAFVGHSMIQQHRMVKGVFDAEIASGALHAITLKTFTPDEWVKYGSQK